jgi:hydroxymethylglutaryl-CoA synthase
VECYLKALSGAYLDYKEQALLTSTVLRPPGGHFLDAIDYAVLHAPFQSMPIQAMQDLLMKARKISREEAQKELDRLRLTSGLDLISRTGNLYTGSLYLCLADLLTTEYARIGDDLEGKRILLASYGSGNTMLVFGGTVAAGAGKVIEQMELTQLVAASRRQVSLDEYEDLNRIDKFAADEFAWYLRDRGSRIPIGACFLNSIRDDGYRVYKRRS